MLHIYAYKSCTDILTGLTESVLMKKPHTLKHVNTMEHTFDTYKATLNTYE